MRSSYISRAMKAIILFFLMFWALPQAWAQEVEYVYDAAGNRTMRKIINLQPSSPQGGGGMGKSATDDSGKQPEDAAIQQYDDILGERKVTIYPNPTQGMIRIEFQGYEEMNDARLLLYDIQGKLLRQANKVEESNTLDLSPYPDGMYILQIIEGKAKSEWKIVKEN